MLNGDVRGIELRCCLCTLMAFTYIMMKHDHSACSVSNSLNMNTVNRQHSGPHQKHCTTAATSTAEFFKLFTRSGHYYITILIVPNNHRKFY